MSAWLRRLGLQRRPTEPTAPVQRYEWPTAGDMIHRGHQARWAASANPDTGCMAIAGGARRAPAGSTRTSPSMTTRGWRTWRCCPTSGGPACARLPRSRGCLVSGARDHVSSPAQRQRQRVSVAASFGEGCAALALRHRRTRPYTPRTNGKAERFIQTLQREWAYARRYATSQERRRALRPWVRYYNRERPHASLGYQPPLTRLQRAA